MSEPTLALEWQLKCFARWIMRVSRLLAGCSVQVVFLGLLILSQNAPAEAPRLPRVWTAGDSTAYLFAGAYIDALTSADLGNSRIFDASSTFKRAPSLAAIAGYLAALELSARDLESAAWTVAPYKTARLSESTPMNEITRKQEELMQNTAKLAEMVYGHLADLKRIEIASIRRSLSEKAPEHPSALIDSLADSEVSNQSAWESLVATAPAVAHVIVDPEPGAAGRMSRMRLTKGERDDLVRAIDKAFGSRARPEPPKEGRTAVEGAASILRSFLLQPYTMRNQQ